MWIEQRGQQHRVYWRNEASDGARRLYEPFDTPQDAQQFRSMVSVVGLDVARTVLHTQDPAVRRALLAEALDLPQQRRSAPVSVSMAAAAAPAGQHPDGVLTGIVFDDLWAAFLSRQRQLEEGTAELYASYGEHHILPRFTGLDVGLIQRRRPLRAQARIDGAVYVEDDWVPEMLGKRKLDNQGREREGTLLSIKFISNVLTVLAACFDSVQDEIPGHTNPARRVCLPKQDRREMFFLVDAAAYARLRMSIEPHFRPLLDFLVGTGARYGEAAGLLVRNLDLDASVPHVNIRQALKWRGKKWKLGRPKTRSSRRRIDLPPKLVEVLRALVQGKGPDDHVFTMVEGGPLHHGNFTNRYFRPAVAAASSASLAVPARLRVHDLRHTHAAWLLCAGTPVIVVARRLGHSSTSTTQDVYGHVTPDADGRSVEVADRMLPEFLALDEVGAHVLPERAEEKQLPEFDIDDDDDLAA